MKLFLAIILLFFTWSYLNADNPVVKGKGHGDPHIRIFNDKVYIYVSHDVDPNAKDFVMRDWYVLSSDDMIKWDVKCILKAEDTYIGANDHCWAVDAASRNGKYYLYFSEWNNQWFNAFTIFDPQVFYRATGLTYIHYKKDGSIADVDPLILKYGVGQYESTWERIEAEWYMAANDDSRKEELENSGFAVVNEERKIELKYPNIHKMSENALMNIRLNTKQNGWIKIYDTSTGRILGKERINASNDWQNIQIRLKNPKGDNNITIKTPKNIYIDYFSFD